MTLLLFGVVIGFVARIFVEAHSKINRDLKSIQQDVPADTGRDE